MRIRIAAVLAIAALALGGAVASLAHAQAQSQNITAYFSPEDQPGRAVVTVFNNARQQIFFAIYDLTDRSIANALISAARRGVQVWGVMDQGEAHSRATLYPELAHALGSHLVLRSGTGRYGIMHNKIAVVDGHITITGSFNWTREADCCNWENLVIIDDASLAKRFASEFRKMWSQQP